MPTEFDPNVDPTRNRMGTTGPATARGGNGGWIAGIIIVVLIIAGLFAWRGNMGGGTEGRSVSTAPATTSSPATPAPATKAPANNAPAPATPAPAAPAPAPAPANH